MDTTKSKATPGHRCTTGTLMPAKNYAPEHVECRDCGALWLQWTPEREAAPAMREALARLVRADTRVAEAHCYDRSQSLDSMGDDLRAAYCERDTAIQDARDLLMQLGDAEEARAALRAADRGD